MSSADSKTDNKTDSDISTNTATNTPSDTPNPTTASTQTSVPAPKPSSKIISTGKFTLVAMLVVFAIGTAIILWAWNLGPFNSALQQTDNSYIKGQSTILSSQIAGYVDKVYVNDFAQVKQGEPLISINSANYNPQVEQAESALVIAQTNFANQQQTLEQRKADIKAALAKVEQAQTQYQLSLQQLKRYQQLIGVGAVSQAELDTAKANVANNAAILKGAKASVDVAIQALKTVEVAKTGLAAQINSAKSQITQANTLKNYSTITAPISGRLGPVNVHNGQYVAAGTQLMYVVPPYTWVIANFKETQMNNIRVGQPAWITIDALNGEKFTGKVNSISPAAGSEFSVIKTDNATGNFTKIVQRIAVRIELDKNQKDLDRVIPGMSALTTVDTAH